MAQERLHVVPHDDGWAVKAENTAGQESTHSTQREAIDAARELCRKREADMVIHRLDGTIRNVYAYGEANNAGDYEEDNNMATERKERLEISDVASVGSRISWGAILGGAFVALSMMIALTALCTALGLTVSDRVSDQTMFYAGVIALLAVSLGSLFIGGYIVSCATAGETKSEAIMYGIVMWGTVVVLLAGLTAGGVNVGVNAIARADEIGSRAGLPTQERMEQMGFDRAAVLRLEEAMAEGAPRTNVTEGAWWTFVAIILSMAAAVGGSIVGAGPTLFLRRLRTAATAPAVRVTTTG